MARRAGLSLFILGASICGIGWVQGCGSSDNSGFPNDNPDGSLPGDDSGIGFGNDGGFTGIALPQETFDGVFIGGGVEYSFDWLPGLFLKSEGRAAWFNSKDSRAFCVTAGTACNSFGNPQFITDDDLMSRRPITYIAKTELVYRFNWCAPGVVAKY